MRNRNVLGSLAVASLLLSGCAAAVGAPGTAPADSQNRGSQTTGSQPATPAPVSSSPAATEAASAGSTRGPSEASKMICNDDTTGDISQILALTSAPRTESTWADSTYTCTYRLAGGPLVITVKESPDAASARKHFAALHRKLRGAEPIKGLANLGFPAYQTADGSVVFLKDNSTLHVDGTRLPAALGPNGVTPAEFSYQVATTILACWTKHH
ncbi:hypothetical protein [Arthrobacter sp. D1-17]